jgi:hypothetical protein
MLLKSSNRPVDYNEPEETKLYKVRQAQERINRLKAEGMLELRRPEAGDVLSRGLDKQKLQAKYDPKKETGVRYLMGVYRVPIGVSLEQLHNLDKENVVKWIGAMSKMGWDWVQGSQVETGEGVYPAQDLDTGLKDFGMRERIIRTKFRKREIEIVMTELRPSVLRDLVVGERGNVSERS